MADQPTHDVDGVGVRSAVTAARKAIFLVELMRAEQRRSLLVGSCQRWAESKKLLGGIINLLSADSEASKFHDELLRIVGMVPAQYVEDPELQQQWQEIQSLCARADVDVMDRTLTNFVHAATRPLVRWIQDALSLIWRNFATIAGIAVTALLFFGVEQVRALLFERWWYWMAALLAIVPIPMMALLGLWLRRRKSGSRAHPLFAAWVGVGFFWRPAARYPEGYDVLQTSPNLGKRLLATVATKAAIFFVWLLIAFQLFDLCAPRYEILQTLGQITCLLSMALGVLAVLDLWDFIHPAPVRRMFLILGGLIWAIYSFNDVSGWMLPVGFFAALFSLAMVYFEKPKMGHSPYVVAMIVCGAAVGIIASEEETAQKESWKSSPGSSSMSGEESLLKAEEWPHGSPTSLDPVIVMTASGGGSRAALLTIFALQELAKVCPVRLPAPLPKGTDPALVRGHCLRAQQTHAEANRAQAEDLQAQMNAQRKLAEDQQERGEPITAQQVIAQCDSANLSQYLQAISSVSGGSLATATYVASRLKNEQDDLSYKMADDFLQPVLDGALMGNISRGGMLEKHWRDVLQLDDRLSNIAKRWRRGLSEPHPPLPVPIFNSTTLDAHAVVLTPFDWTPYRDEDERFAFAGQSHYLGYADPTWIYYRWGVYSLEDLVPNYNPTLAEAVRASANFPFGFPVVQLDVKQSLVFSPLWRDRGLDNGKERVRLTDGGVLSNSGMWTLVRFLSEPERIKELERRGLILIIVDATKMPEYGGRTRTLDLVNAIMDETPVAGNLHATMIGLLKRLLGDRMAVVDFGINPECRSNIYTSWALDYDSRTELETSAREGLGHMVDETQLAFCELSNSSGKPKVRLARYPLD